MTTWNVDDEFRELLEEFLDGQLDESARQRLRNRLHDDADAQQLYLELCEAHAALTWEHGMILTDAAPKPAASASPSPSSSRRLRVTSAVGMLVATLLIVLAWPGPENREPPLTKGEIVATLTNRIDAVLTRGQTAWSDNKLRIGEYNLERGLMEFELESGVTVIVEAPSLLEFRSEDYLVLHSGRLSANVPPEGVGFTVETPEAEVVDFGTEFSVEASAGKSEVHVFAGLVSVRPKAADGGDIAESVELRTAQAVRIAETNSQPAGIDLATDRFIRSIKETEWVYPKLVRRWKPVAYYRMAIQTLGLACTSGEEPFDYLPEYAGEVLKGTGQKPPYAPGRIGMALRIGEQSLGRGGMIPTAPPLPGDAFSIAVWVRLASRPVGAIVVTDFDGAACGRYSLQLDPVAGHLQAVVRTEGESLVEVVEPDELSLNEWHHVVLVCDGQSLTMFRNGRVVASTPCGQMAPACDEACWIGTASGGRNLWDGLIDELAFFDRALTNKQVKVLYDAVEDLPVGNP
ncbi:MAG: iron dicitrate transport regulator FecR [Fuerstiella sp.]|nr:iron dicitrate transport regulator FecR [Fuerstiella sp.]MCP4855609.1 iron dicitrate transport regulator FecR [Fuerstiella sp.]